MRFSQKLLARGIGIGTEVFKKENEDRLEQGCEPPHGSDESGLKGIETCWSRENGTTPLAKRDGSKEFEDTVSEKRQLAGSLAPSKEKSFGEV